MNTKNILRTLALSLLLVSACSKNEIAYEENTDAKGYTLPVTVNVTRQGDDNTKATYNDGTKKLAFSTGDKLFVRGYHENAGDFAGNLDMVSEGTFSGTISTENEYTGTADNLFATSDNVKAYLLPNGYESIGYLTYEDNSTAYGYDDIIHDDITYAFAQTKAAGVEQLSLEITFTYSNGFALEPGNAILSFTITGLASSTLVNVVFNRDGIETYGSVTTNASGTATFAIGVPPSDLNECSLTVGGKAITLVSSEKTLSAGNIYNITRSAADPNAPLSGVFSVSTTKKVAFSKGNLTRTSDKWAFLSNSWEYNTSPSVYNTTNGAQHFEWGTVFKSADSGESAVVEGITTDLGSGWRGLSLAEWRYLLGYDYNSSPREQASKREPQWHHYAIISGAGIGTGNKCYLLIFPDEFKDSDWNTTTMGTAPTYFDATTNNSIAYTEAHFTAMQDAGIVILPAAGYRSGTDWVMVGGYGYYWSSTSYSSANAYYLYFANNRVQMSNYTKANHYHPVRLVQDVVTP